MKKVGLFLMLAVFTLSTSSFKTSEKIDIKINERSSNNTRVLKTTLAELKLIKYNSNFNNYIELDNALIDEDGSIKCWLAGKWLKRKLSAISDNESLIEATVDAVVGACNALIHVFD